MNKKRRMVFNAGTSSILIIFVLLCLAAFAVLSLVSANADYKLSTTFRDRINAYYEASNRAELKLADIDSMLDECYTQSSSEDSYFSLVSEHINMTEDHKFSWNESIAENQQLDIGLTILYPTVENPHYYKIDFWKTYQIENQKENSTLNLLDMEAEK